jgi:poly-gamma-glutamate capsule biosynthesis protein CapA/YwtB (metallophosphatase superfamily)
VAAIVCSDVLNRCSRDVEATMGEPLEFDTGTGGPAWSLVVAGDCVLDRDADQPLLADCVQRRVDEAEFTIANLEAPLPVDTDPIPKSGPALTTDPDSVDRLVDAGFDVLALANNHLMDYGAAGLRATQAACDAANVETVGAGESRADALDPVHVHQQGVDVAVVNVCEREYGVASRTDPGTAPADHRDAVETVREAAHTADVVVLVSHGGVEYVPLPPPTRRDRLREFVDAGADLVVGHHPHVAQGWEVYHGVPIFPSLGNFAFDRQGDHENTSRGLLLEVRFEGDSLTRVDPVPTVLDGPVRELSAVEADGFGEYLTRASAALADDEQYEAHWQTVAERLFYERYSNWLLTGVGETLGLARAQPTDPQAQRPHWDPDRRRAELLTLLNVVRNESHNDVLSTALALLAGDEPDRRTDAVSTAVDEMLEWTAR